MIGLISERRCRIIYQPDIFITKKLLCLTNYQCIMLEELTVAHLFNKYLAIFKNCMIITRSTPASQSFQKSNYLQDHCHTC